METPQQTKLPIPVIAIAVFEFVRAALILLMALSPFTNYRPDLVPKTTVQVVTMNSFFIFVSRSETFYGLSTPTQSIEEQRADAVLRLFIAGPIAAAFAWLGFGLLLRKKWGRSCAVASSALFVLYWLRWLVFDSAFDKLPGGGPYSRYSAETWQSIWLALAINLLICLYLAAGNGIAHAFGQKE